ncbi:phage major capsid protein [Corynebacterium pyruviciproducens]|uniref:Phage major capsid protein n=1 Tax=Corynebacterium pyruviciproducens TaxID=598660 RepID=A0AAF1BT21_9CORY|nr:phage major capsid protein [Corynebacterium pyruviciproducens]WOT03378.1 phage major capsid protein [Corynebacterium pyruviciproducens]
MAIDNNKFASTGDFKGFLEPKLAAPIFEEMQRKSIVQPLAKKVEMGPTGVDIPFWDGDVTASWVKEAGKKPLTKGGFSKFSMAPEKIATIFVMSAEVVRANPQNYISTMREKVAEAFAIAFDEAALHGTNSPFDKNVDQTKKTVSLFDKSGKANVYAATNGALELLVKDGKKFTGGLLDTVTEPVINDSLDANGRPLFIESTYTDTNSLTRQGRILSRPVTIADNLKKDSIVGYYGDFSKLLWGQVGGISYDVSDQATLDLSAAQDGSGLTSLWQNNLVAVRCEAEFAIHVHDPEAFVKVTDTKVAA